MEIKTGHVETFKRTFSQQDFDRFAQLSHDTNPIHIDPVFSARTRFGNTVAHGMMLYGMICSVLGSRFPGPGTLQIKQDMMFKNPTYTKTQVTVLLEVVSVHPQNMTAVIETKIHLPNGDDACVGETLVCLPGASLKFPGIDPSFGILGPVSDQFSNTTRADTLKHLKIGQKAENRRVFTAADLAEYASLTGDENPLFSDERFAQNAGFDGCIIPGPLLSGMFSDILGTRLPGRGTNWLKQALHFPAPAYIDNEITASVEIVKLKPDKDLVYLLDTCRNSSGQLVCQAQSLVLVKDLEKN